MNAIELTLPWPPSLNSYYRNVRGKTLISADGRAYRKAVIISIMQAGCPNLAGRLSVFVSLYPPDKRARDIDNSAKALLDAMQHAGVYESDSQIDRLVIERCRVVADGEVKVSVSMIDATPAQTPGEGG